MPTYSETVYSGEDIYEDYYIVDELSDDAHLFPFFEVGDDSFICLDLSRETSSGNHPVIYEVYQVADSLEEFLHKLDATPGLRELS